MQPVVLNDSRVVVLPDACSLRARVNCTLLEILQVNHVRVRFEHGAVQCDPLPLEATCSGVWIDAATATVRIEICLVLRREARAVLRETTVGCGDNWDSAILMALGKWYHSVFVTAAALYDPLGYPGHLASVAQRRWPAGEGHLRLWSLVSNAGAVWHEGDTPTSREVLSPLAPLLDRLAVHHRLHWLMIFMARSRGEAIIDCTVNSQPAPQVNRLFDDFEWLRDGHDKNARYFFILKPGLRVPISQ